MLDTVSGAVAVKVGTVAVVWAPLLHAAARSTAFTNRLAARATLRRRVERPLAR